MPHVYILSDYEEHGANNVTATLDRGKLPAMVDANWPPGDTPDWNAKAKAGLAKLLERPDEELAGPNGHNATDGWGGLMLHVVELV